MTRVVKGPNEKTLLYCCLMFVIFENKVLDDLHEGGELFWGYLWGRSWIFVVAGK